MQKANHHSDTVKAHFDRYAQRWSDLYHQPQIANDMVLLNRKDTAVAFLCQYLKPGSKILDAGCGAGVVSMDVVQKGFFVHGMDLSKKMLELCERNFSQSSIPPSKYCFTLGNVTDIDFPESSFDGILALGFLEYQEDESKALDSFQKLLRPGGILVLSGPIKLTISNLFGLAKIYFRVKNRMKSRLANTRERTTTRPTPAVELSINQYSLSRFKMLLESACFTLIGYKRHGYANFWLPRPFNRLINLIGGSPAEIDEGSISAGELVLHRALTKISTFLPIDRFANDIIVVARK